MEENATTPRCTAAETGWLAYQTGLELRPLPPEGWEEIERPWAAAEREWLRLPDTELEAAFPLRAAPDAPSITDLRIRFRLRGEDQAAPEEAWLGPPIGKSFSYGGVERIIKTSPEVWRADVRIILPPGRRAIRRYALRPHGLTGLWAGYGGGMAITKPLPCAGGALTVNYATSAAGSLRIGVLDGDSQPVPGLSAEDCYPLYGNALAEPVRFRGGRDLSGWTGKTIRLIFEMRDGILCAFQFGK